MKPGNVINLLAFFLCHFLILAGGTSTKGGKGRLSTLLSKYSGGGSTATGTPHGSSPGMAGTKDVTVFDKATEWYIVETNLSHEKGTLHVWSGPKGPEWEIDYQQNQHPLPKNKVFSIRANLYGERMKPFVFEDKDGQKIGSIENASRFPLLHMSEINHNIIIDDKPYARMKKDRIGSFFRQQFSVTLLNDSHNPITIKSVFGAAFNYDFFQNNNVIASFKKHRMELRDTYLVEIQKNVNVVLILSCAALLDKIVDKTDGPEARTVHSNVGNTHHVNRVQPVVQVQQIPVQQVPVPQVPGQH